MTHQPITHDIEERRTPIAILITCSCGWHSQITRRQNALARASKVRAAIRAHLNTADEGKT